MTRLVALLALAVASSLPPTVGSAAAQPARQCATPTPSVADRLRTDAIVQRFRVAGIRTDGRGPQPIVIPVAFHVLSSGPNVADGNLPLSQIEAQIDVLDAAFRPHGFSFVLAAVTRTVNPTWASGVADGSARAREMKQALHKDTGRFLNIYSVDAVGDLLGWATLPYSQSENDAQDGVVVDRATLPGGAFAPFNEGDTATHEVGHWLGLYHTFNEDAPPGDPCGGPGDEVDDTPVEARPASGCPTGRDTCPALPGVDPITNFMDYSDDACMVEFSSGQADRMRALTAAFRPTIAAGVPPLAAPEAIAFGDVFVGVAARQTVRVINPSRTALTVTSVTSSNPAFVPSATAFTVGAGESAEVEVTFMPEDAEAASATLTLLTSGGDPLVVEVAGQGRFAPDLDVLTPAVARALAPDETDTAVFTIGNTGRGELEYQFVGRTSARTAAAPSGVSSARMPTAKEAGHVAAARRGDGGPDAFGTTWIDSDEPSGPTYAWVDIASSGTVHTLEDDGSVEVALPFDFPFYGETETRVWINANGFLTFDGTVEDSYRNLTLPTAGGPSVIAPYWDDFDPTSGGGVLSKDLGGGRFAVTWEDLPHYTDTGSTSDPGRFRFQAILSSDGGILFQYAEIEPGSYAASATVGIQPSDGATGLQVAYNAVYARDELAVRFTPQATWIRTVTPSSGTVAPGGEQRVTLALDATGLAPGAYQDLVALATNDPFRPDLRVHVVLGVGGALAPPALADPAYAAADTPARLRLDWLDAAAEYEVQVARDEGFQDLVLSDGVASSQVVFSGDTETRYWWRVRSVDGGTRSDWSLAFPFTTGTEPGDIELEPIAFRVDDLYPNPAGGIVRVPFTLAEDRPVRVEVYDAVGRLVLATENGVTYRTGLRNTFRVDVSVLPPGLYVVRLMAGAESATRRLVVVR